MSPATAPAPITTMRNISPVSVQQRQRTRQLQQLRQALGAIFERENLPFQFCRDDTVNGEIIATVTLNGLRFRWGQWPHYNPAWPDHQAPVLLFDCAQCQTTHNSRAIHSKIGLNIAIEQMRCN